MATTAERKILFLGSKAIGLKCLTLVHEMVADNLLAAVIPDDSQDTRNKQSAFKAFAHENHLPCFSVSDNGELEALIQRFQPDLCVVIGWYRMIPPKTLHMVPDGFIGLHASLLPRYRGGSPLNWAIINGETKTGITVFYFDAGMDTGDIIDQSVVDIREDDDIASVLTRIESSALCLLQKNLPFLLKGSGSHRPQDHGMASYCGQRYPSDGRINWNRTARELHNFIRAQTAPYPGAFFLKKDNTPVTVWKAAPYSAPCYGIAGQVIRIDRRFVVCCSDGAVELIQIESPAHPEGTCTGSIIHHGERLR